MHTKKLSDEFVFGSCRCKVTSPLHKGQVYLIDFLKSGSQFRNCYVIKIQTSLKIYNVYMKLLLVR
jgi:hypothetical protein